MGGTPASFPKGPTFESGQTSRLGRFSSVLLQMGRACDTYGERGGAYKELKNAMVRDLLEDTVVDRRIILKQIFINTMGKRKMD